MHMIKREPRQNQQSKNLCRFFQKGTCKFGSRCRFVHELDKGREGQNAKNEGSEVMDCTSQTAVDKTEAELLLNIIQSDVKNWALGKMWPLSCYGPLKYFASMAGLEEYSQEEIRLAGVEAQSSGKVDDYLTQLGAACSKNSQVIKQVVCAQGEEKEKILENLKGFLAEAKGFLSQPFNLSTIADEDADVTMREV